MTEADRQCFLDRAAELVSRAETTRKNTVFAMMQPHLTLCEPENRSVTVEYPAQHWEQNSNGVIHGGIVAAMMDVAMGTLTYALTGDITPTVSLNICFPRPAPGDGTLRIRAEATMAGRTLLYVRAAMLDTRAPEKPVATAEGVFHNATGTVLQK